MLFNIRFYGDIFGILFGDTLPVLIKHLLGDLAIETYVLCISGRLTSIWLKSLWFPYDVIIERSF